MTVRAHGLSAQMSHVGTLFVTKREVKTEWHVRVTMGLAVGCVGDYHDGVTVRIYKGDGANLWWVAREVCVRHTCVPARLRGVQVYG